MAHDQFIEFVVALITVIFKQWHDIPPYIQICNGSLKHNNDDDRAQEFCIAIGEQNGLEYGAFKID